MLGITEKQDSRSSQGMLWRKKFAQLPISAPNLIRKMTLGWLVTLSFPLVIQLSAAEFIENLGPEGNKVGEKGNAKFRKENE